MRKLWSVLPMALACCLWSCTTRQVVDDFQGSTAQRLTTYSIDAVMDKLPDDPLSLLADKRVHLECAFPEATPAIDYARRRLEMELIHRYDCALVASPEEADLLLRFFFNSIGTGVDQAGFRTPEFALPGMGGMAGIDLLTLDMFHGVSECYYYILDRERKVLAKSDRIKAVIRSDKVGLPIISFPVTHLK
jgi:hypothetical protein